MTFERILGIYLPAQEFRVILLEGNGSAPNLQSDTLIIQKALRTLGWPSATTIRNP
jgi:hypothetical protein